MTFSIKVMVKIDGTCIQSPLTFGLCDPVTVYQIGSWLEIRFFFLFVFFSLYGASIKLAVSKMIF